ncbi:MAG: hypothetical protein LBT60_07275, partial [Oscillospiraceae bacterium]|nr:hypothetical protein [Oscillospiraceae bacterium]
MKNSHAGGLRLLAAVLACVMLFSLTTPALAANAPSSWALPEVEAAEALGLVPGSVVGGFVYAAIANVLSLTLPSGMLSFRDVVMFVIVILFLVLRPEGLIRG